jgi:hypothetical protein
MMLPKLIPDRPVDFRKTCKQRIEHEMQGLSDIAIAFRGLLLNRSDPDYLRNYRRDDAGRTPLVKVKQGAPLYFLAILCRVLTKFFPTDFLDADESKRENIFKVFKPVQVFGAEKYAG